ncbi:MAG: S46 family peptidase, partial [Flavobacterium sp.]|nr:S46 family peptidase [Flavobacterium sp.]
LKRSNAIQIKRDFEKDFMNKVTKAGKQAEYGNLLSEFETNYKAIAPYALSRDYFMEVVMRNTELLSFGYRLYQLEQIYNIRGEQAFNDRKGNLIAGFEDLYKDFNPTVDEKVMEQLIEIYATKSPKELLPKEIFSLDLKAKTSEIFKTSKLTSYNGLKELLNGDAKNSVAALNKDSGYQFVKMLAEAYNQNVVPKFDEINLKNNALQRTYMKGILELSPKEARIFPDANSTLRVTYGKVKGYAPSDAVYYSPVTYLDGIIEKYIPGDYEFDVPSKLLELYNNKDYGDYAENGKLPINFIATNHTTGGNSGSPAIDANGNLIGLNFDRVWEGTMSDIYYDPEICSNIMVDVRYILFVIDKYANAKHLIDEMTLVKSKKKKKNTKKG